MKKTAIILFLVLAIPALLTSCLFDEEDLFDKSASERIEAAKQEAIELTGLENPKSREQMLTWLQGHGVAIPDLRSATVEDALEHKDEFEPDVARVLELRQLLSKASIKKYSTVVTTMCEDGRIRGLLQFYGANRTGRWAGRLVQVQNLPRNYIETLDVARVLICTAPCWTPPAI